MTGTQHKDRYCGRCCGSPADVGVVKFVFKRRDVHVPTVLGSRVRGSANNHGPLNSQLQSIRSYGNLFFQHTRGTLTPNKPIFDLKNRTYR